MKPRSSKNNRRRSKEPSQSASRQPALWSRSLRAVGFGIGTVICVMVLLGASGQNEDQETENRKKIEAMTPAERAQLKRNYEKFQKLSAKEKQRFRELHSATRSQPELNRVMRSYCDWVKTLTPWEQEDLRNETDPKERLKLIRKFRSQQIDPKRRSDLRSYIAMSKFLNLDSRDPRRMGLMWVQPPPPELFEEVIGIIDQNLTGAEKKPKVKKQSTDFAYSVAVLERTLRLKHQKGDSGGVEWSHPEVLNQIHQLFEAHHYSIRDPKLQHGFKLQLRGNRNDLRKTQVSLFLIRGLTDQLFSLVKQELTQHNPADEELHKFFENLDAKSKDSLMKYPPDEMQEKLKYMFLQKHFSEEIRKKLNRQLVEFKNLRAQLFRGIDLKPFMFESRIRHGVKGHVPDTKDGRNKGPKGGGDRTFRGRKPERRPGVQRRDRPDA
ncbi:hypothetical protein [Gimesia aquarii]|uniref:Uncharacterized protein n=1 Tax=Gimesia aquarii TaxID=2527964 RepID=A0A517X3S8_9PLAN|nr:hypothetical protein [Gimesia aquarii]QDU12160.1 hypothetical protein V202x_55850 [Gimesia aquarii]